MAKINTLNYQTVASWNGSQDLFVVEQPDGTKVATPAMVKQFIEAGDFEATGEVKDGHGNILKDMAKSADVDAEIGDLSQTGLIGDSVAEQLDTAREQIANLTSNALDNPIDIKNYTSSNRYQVPKDGYIRYRVRSGESGGCTIYGSNQSNSGYLFGYIITAAHDTREIIFVKKGMYVQNDGAYALEYVGLS